MTSDTLNLSDTRRGRADCQVKSILLQAAVRLRDPGAGPWRTRPSLARFNLLQDFLHDLESIAYRLVGNS